MNINSESRFAVNPVNIDAQRSTFNRPYDVKTTFNAGSLVPFYLDEVYPGDSFEITTSKVVRLQTLMRPIMDNIYLDTFYFFVPNTILWKDWNRFMGERIHPWYDDTELVTNLPLWKAPPEGIQSGTLADYMGLPIGPRTANALFNSLPFRAYAKICDDWFRSESLSDAVVMPFDSSATINSGNDRRNLNTTVIYGWKPFQVGKLHDYFTSSLPVPNIGGDVKINMSGLVPVHTGTKNIEWSELGAMSGHTRLRGFLSNDGVTAQIPVNIGLNSTIPSTQKGSLDYNYSSPAEQFVPSNLYADLGFGGVMSLSDLRFAAALAHYRETSARTGSRYIEIIKGHFGVTSPDARLGRSEFLGANRIPININEVVNTSENSLPNSYLGNVGATSSTADSDQSVRFSATEHGWIIGLMVARYDHSYSQGAEKFWMYKDINSFYFPEFANISDQPISTDEIYYTGSDDTFGYQEAWAHLRYKPNKVTGEMRPDIPEESEHKSLAMWHLGDHYEVKPNLSEDWLSETPENLDRALAVKSTVSDQFFADIFVMNKTTRILPLYSIPGISRL